MWTRFHIECQNCEKITNLRVHIPEKEIMPINFDCPNCSSSIKSELIVDLKKPAFDFKVLKGKLVKREFHKGDYFYEFSDTLPTKSPSSSPHQTQMATMRMTPRKLEQLKQVKDQRKFHNEEDWDNFQDLTKAYSNENKPLIIKLSKRIIGKTHPKKIFNCKHDLDYQQLYFLVLNFLVYPWIDFKKHKEFTEWLNGKIFGERFIKDNDFKDLYLNIISDVEIKKIRTEIGLLNIQFAQIKENFSYAYNDQSTIDNFAGNQEFNKIKNFYCDCFEFMGRSSHIVFRLQNLFERGNQNSIPNGSPKNVKDANSFASLAHGNKLDIIKLSSDPIPIDIFINSFDNKLRNGINHFKTSIDNNSQVISYYPITKKPNDEYQIKYIEFLNKTLDIYNSVLKIGQIIKTFKVCQVTRPKKTDKVRKHNKSYN